jgi:LEA14-like dessication related protein
MVVWLRVTHRRTTINKQLAPALLLLTLLSTGCLSYQEVSFKGITDMDVTKMDNDGISARVMVTLDNPNNFRIHVIDPDVDLFLNDVYIGKATLDSNLVLDKQSTKDYAVPLSAALTGQAKLKAKGSVVGRAFLIRKRFPFEEEHAFDWGR